MSGISWLDRIPPKIRALVQRKPLGENLWFNCPNCSQLLYHAELKKNLQVCHHCSHHLRMNPRERLASIFDGGEHILLPMPTVEPDPLKFRDSKRYVDRLKEARAATSAEDCIVVATGKIGGENSVVAVMNFAFMGGSMGRAMGEGMIVGIMEAYHREMPFIMFATSGGARMQEGILSLMQMARTTAALQQLRERNLPYVVVLCDPTTGGVTASFAMLGDIQIAEPNARIGFAGPRVIEATVREQLPEGFQRSEYLRDHGMLDMVVHRHQLRETLVKILNILMAGRTRMKKLANSERMLTDPVMPAMTPETTGGESPQPTKNGLAVIPTHAEETWDKTLVPAASGPSRIPISVVGYDPPKNTPENESKS